jgi:redox-sensitive bicupin YhaK (pirin superfamily)
MINQQAYISLGVWDTATTYTTHAKEHGIFLMCISGSLRIGDYTLGARDALEITGMDKVDIVPNGESQVMVVEVLMG